MQQSCEVARDNSSFSIPLIGALNYRDFTDSTYSGALHYNSDMLSSDWGSSAMVMKFMSVLSIQICIAPVLKTSLRFLLSSDTRLPYAFIPLFRASETGKP